jgi:hypothetical protein
LANDARTAICELRPHPGHKVSIGKFILKWGLHVADLANLDFYLFADNDKSLEDYVLLKNVDHAFAMPVLPGDSGGYLLTQFLANIFRLLDLDGVIYRSSVTAGLNLASFRPDAFRYEPSSGYVQRIRSVSYEVEDERYELEEDTSGDVEYRDSPTK